MKHYTIISGTGRAGTTFLVRVLTAAGVDTGFDATNLKIDAVAHAGLERDLRRKPSCYVVKSPWLPAFIEEVLADDEISIDHAIICMRDLHDAAESRRRVQTLRATDASVPGGLWKTSDPAHQEAVLADMFYRLIFHLTAHDIPITYLHFPRFAVDPEYSVAKLSGVFREVDPARLEAALRSEVRPELISDFRGDKRST